MSDQDDLQKKLDAAEERISLLFRARMNPTSKDVWSFLSSFRLNHDWRKVEENWDEWWRLVTLWEQLGAVRDEVEKELVRRVEIKDSDAEWSYRTGMCQWPGGCFRTVRRNKKIRLCDKHESHVCTACGAVTHPPVGVVCSDCYVAKGITERLTGKDWEKICKLPPGKKRRGAWVKLKATIDSIDEWRYRILTKFSIPQWERLRQRMIDAEKKRKRK